MTSQHNVRQNVDTSIPPPDDDMIAAFTELASSYERTVDGELRTFLGLGYAEFLDLFLSRIAIQPGDRVLDVATGTAQIPLVIAGRVGEGGKVVGLDITPKMLKYAAK